MPLTNNETKIWEGWLIDDLGGQEQLFHNALVTSLESRKIPKGTVTTGKVNMWSRKDSRIIDVISNMDGPIVCSIHIQEYGTSLWIGRAVQSYEESNYYKRMAASAFVVTIDRCIRDTLLTMVKESAIHYVADIGEI
jgi:hypothetical protein